MTTKKRVPTKRELEREARRVFGCRCKIGDYVSNSAHAICAIYTRSLNGSNYTIALMAGDSKDEARTRLMAALRALPSREGAASPSLAECILILRYMTLGLRACSGTGKRGGGG